LRPPPRPHRIWHCRPELPRHSAQAGLSTSSLTFSLWLALRAHCVRPNSLLANLSILLTRSISTPDEMVILPAPYSCTMRIQISQRILYILLNSVTRSTSGCNLSNLSYYLYVLLNDNVTRTVTQKRKRHTDS